MIYRALAVPVLLGASAWCVPASAMCGPSVKPPAVITRFELVDIGEATPLIVFSTIEIRWDASGGEIDPVFQAAWTWNASDVDRDGRAGVSDIIMILSNWGYAGSDHSDVNRDGFVDAEDLLAVISRWGSGV